MLRTGAKLGRRDMDRRKILLVVAVIVAALGAGLVFVYAQGAEDRAAKQLTTTQVIVASKEIAAGESAADAAKSGKLISQSVQTDQIIAGSTNDGSVFTDQVALTTIYPGEQLVTQKFGTADQVEGAQLLVLPEGDYGVQVPLTDYGKVGAFTQPGSHVVIFVAGTPTVPAAGLGTGSPQADGTAGDPSTTVEGTAVPVAEVLLPDVLVLAVGSGTTQVGQVDPNGQPIEVTPLTNLTLAVNLDDAKKVIGAASDSGLTLWFGLRNSASGDAGAGRSNGSNGNGSGGKS